MKPAPSTLVASVVVGPWLPRTLIGPKSVMASCRVKPHVNGGKTPYILFISPGCPGVGRNDGKWRENLPLVSVEG